MSPGINDHPYNTGTLPKSNRRSDRNRQIVDNTVNNQENNWITNDRGHYRAPPTLSQHANNLSQVDWHLVYQTAPPPPTSSARSGKNSNTRSTYPPPAPASSTGSLDFRDFGPYNNHNRYPNLYSQPENIIPWLKMTSPHQPPPNFAEKPTNTDKMPERYQVEGRLNQIREYIKVTTSMMDSLSRSADPNGEMVYDEGREQELRKKIDESQRKLIQLQEHQAHLVAMQMRVRERLNEARHAQQTLLASESEEREEEEEIDPEERNGIINGQVTQGNVDQLERETEALRGKLQQLENKKKQMDHLVHELQDIELGSFRSESSKLVPAQQRDRVSELEAMKAQLQHLKTLMNEATRVQENSDVQPSEFDHEENNAVAAASNEVYPTEENGHEIVSEDKSRPTVEQIQAVTNELKEQQQLLLAARAELVRLKQQPSIVSSSPPAEKKLSNNNARCTQNNQRQFEELNRKESYPSLLVNHNTASDGWSNRRECNSLPNSQASTANLWAPSSNSMNGPHEHNVDTMSAQETLLEIGSQPPLDNGNNFWGMPPLITNQLPQSATVGSAEYYRQLLLGSQAQQLQMLTTTLQQCCQLLWSQQREMQSMRAAINQLQAQLRYSQSRTSNNLELHEEHHSNLVRPATQQHFSSIEAVTLPPSSSLPNLMSLPGASPAPPPAISIMSNCQQQQQQLNNQVPPGNRANNYWDNFRSYSRQNLLSGTSKTAIDGATAHVISSTTVSHPPLNNKRNRQQTLENLPSQPSEVHYTLNLQPQQDRESTASAPRNNIILTSEQQSQQPENIGAEASGTLRSEERTDDESYTRIAKTISEREDLRLILMHFLKVLESGKQNVSPLPSSNMSNSSDSSDDESDAGPSGNSAVPIENIHNQNRRPTVIVDPQLESTSSHSNDVQESLISENAVSLPSISSTIGTVGMVESNELNTESLNNEPVNSVYMSDGNDITSGVTVEYSSIPSDISRICQLVDVNVEDEDERVEFVMLDRGSQTVVGGMMDDLQK
ncbi:uncharacterized protein LOC131672904 isoform X2 [Phymastichus coffea]|uniref:uncharacterized protein LOC131672904 isoform X2 n=1 Tax=Phymastichus coffea TaxID=108790 RepID=UPI00273C73E7|nr:uncharacterized protein LOC131672904 isoform X2 [Phymastichus coffea]